jgi:hypothetical protein
MQYENELFLRDESIKKNIVENFKLINVRYTLAWHNITQRKQYDQAYINCEDSEDVCVNVNDIFTGHPQEEYLNTPKEQFNDPWKSNGKKRILLSFHHTVDKKNKYGNYSSFMKCAKMVYDVV